MPSILSAHVLVLNSGWDPIGTTTVADAFSKLFSGAARFMDSETLALHDVEEWLRITPGPHDRVVNTARLGIKVPEIIITKTFAVAKRTPPYSRRNCLRRDKHKCQYCGRKDDLTIDHVNPRRRGGKTSWRNCVTCCDTCNVTKADKTLQEAGMALLPREDMVERFPNDPRKWTAIAKPSWNPVFAVPAGQERESWKRFLKQQ